MSSSNSVAAALAVAPVAVSSRVEGAVAGPVPPETTLRAVGGSAGSSGVGSGAADCSESLLQLVPATSDLEEAAGRLRRPCVPWRQWWRPCGRGVDLLLLRVRVPWTTWRHGQHVDGQVPQLRLPPV